MFEFPRLPADATELFCELRHLLGPRPFLDRTDNTLAEQADLLLEVVEALVDARNQQLTVDRAA